MSVSVPVDYLVAIVQTVVVESLAVAEQVALVAAAVVAAADYLVTLVKIAVV